MRGYLIVALGAVWLSASCQAEDWSLSTWHGGPRSRAMYQEPPRAAPRWRETRQRYPSRHRYDHVAAPELRDDDRREPVRLYRADARAERREGYRCLDRVSVVGPQWATEEGAETNAQKAFMEQVRWNDGEQYMSIENVAGYAKSCARSSIGEIAGQVLYRCEVSARPCRKLMALVEPK